MTNISLSLSIYVYEYTSNAAYTSYVTQELATNMLLGVSER